MSESDILQQKLTRERAARLEAESLLHSKSTELFDLNEMLLAAQEELEEKVESRTKALTLAVDRLRDEIKRRRGVEQKLRIARDEALLSVDAKRAWE